MNTNLILVGGMATTGKSMCLRNLKDHPGVMYLNTENNKALPFKNSFKSYNITDPLQVFEAFDYAEREDSGVHTIAIDSLTYLMDQYESQYVLTAENTLKAWGEYAQYFKKLMQVYVANSTKRVIFLAHTANVVNETEMIKEVLVKVKGSLMTQGIESYFSNVISTKKVQLKQLSDYENDLLNVTEDEEILGFKHVFQTNLTKETVNERIRSPLGMWDRKETFIDNDIEKVFERVADYYGS